VGIIQGSGPVGTVCACPSSLAPCFLLPSQILLFWLGLLPILTRALPPVSIIGINTEQAPSRVYRAVGRRNLLSSESLFRVSLQSLSSEARESPVRLGPIRNPTEARKGPQRGSQGHEWGLWPWIGGS
jgi:hypothetical protein